uniref:Uncharacterized protein n=1 Tax=Piliocolobus tephrosceles TaxID=591936 RepID=A0A8C9H7V0_9PRIM
MHQTWVRLERRLLPDPLPSLSSPDQGRAEKDEQGSHRRGGPAWDGSLCAPGHPGGREGASGARGGVAQAPPRLPAPSIGPERDDLRAEQEGNRSRARRRRRLPAVQLPLLPLSAPPSSHCIPPFTGST